MRISCQKDESSQGETFFKDVVCWKATRCWDGLLAEGALPPSYFNSWLQIILTAQWACGKLFAFPKQQHKAFLQKPHDKVP